MRSFVVLALSGALVLAGTPTWAFNCPVAIKQAEDLIKKAEAGKVSPETKPLIDEAKKLVAEAKAHHENAKTKRDHGDSIRKAKTAAAFAEEAMRLTPPALEHVRTRRALAAAEWHYLAGETTRAGALFESVAGSRGAPGPPARPARGPRR